MRMRCVVLLLACLGRHAPARWAQTPELFRDADLALGEKLVREQPAAATATRARSAATARRSTGPAAGSTRPRALRGMVDYCSTELNLSLFPEEVTAVAAVLQRDHYRFGGAAAPGAKPTSSRGD